jgi:hypothetical protein
MILGGSYRMCHGMSVTHMARLMPLGQQRLYQYPIGHKA